MLVVLNLSLLSGFPELVGGFSAKKMESTGVCSFC